MEKNCKKTRQITIFKKLFGVFPNTKAKKFIEEKLKKAAESIKKEETKDK